MENGGGEEKEVGRVGSRERMKKVHSTQCTWNT